MEHCQIRAKGGGKTPLPLEMPRDNPGFDMRSKDPETGDISFIEVKGRVKGADVVTVTKNEILTALNKPDRFILALVEVGEDDSTQVRYLRHPFAGTKDAYFAVTSVNYEWATLFGRSLSVAGATAVYSGGEQ